MSWLDELRKMKSKSGMTTREIASASNIPEPTLEKLFSGQTKDPKLNTVIQLVHFLGHTLDELTPSDGTKKEPADVTADELTENEQIFKSLPPELRQEALRYLRYLAEQEGKQ